MARRRTSMTQDAGALASSLDGGVREHQTTIFERLDSLTRRAEVVDPRAPATALFCCVVALVTFGLLIQASHASTILEPGFGEGKFSSVLTEQIGFRAVGLLVLILGARIGPSGLRRFIPSMTVMVGILLVCVFLPVVGTSINGSHRWVNLGFLKFQPSELARIVLVLWIADRCVRLGGEVRDIRRGVLPMLAMGLCFFGLIAVETDLGGAMLLLLCILGTMWVGGARPTHVAGSLAAIGGSALVLGFTLIPYIRRRIEMFVGSTDNDQIAGSVLAMHSGGWFGVGLGQGAFRNHGVPYLESDFVFAQVGEEFGLFGMLLVLGLFLAFLWFGLRLVLSIRDRYDALASFGLLLATALQAMLHVQVVAGLAPPKGMTLPFISHGGTSLVVSCLCTGLALGAARRTATVEPQPLARGLEPSSA
ncbi:MAG TPA: FtsW/RodA/SpoVE family cell cycle protein [Planctomycetota bacterium]|nr:FtsW/RodA/SpoVE family cell cycle protein [Planctomycetota bacterium]